MVFFFRITGLFVEIEYVSRNERDGILWNAQRFVINLLSKALEKLFKYLNVKGSVRPTYRGKILFQKSKFLKIKRPEKI